MTSKFSTRQKIKAIPKEGLFLFEVDQMTDIRPTSTIIEDHDLIVKGNTVTLIYDGQKLKAKIIALSGNNILYMHLCEYNSNIKSLCYIALPIQLLYVY